MLNRSVIVGRLTKDVDLRFSANGVAVANFTVAVNRIGKNDETDFISVVCFKKTAENTANFCKKGSLVGIDGRIQTRNYENKEGRKVYVTEIVADTVQFLEPRNTSQSSNSNQFDGEDFPSDDLPF